MDVAAAAVPRGHTSPVTRFPTLRSDGLISINSTDSGVVASITSANSSNSDLSAGMHNSTLLRNIGDRDESMHLFAAVTYVQQLTKALEQGRISLAYSHTD